MRAALAPLTVCCLLAGCAGGGAYPSLAPRAVERAFAEEAPALPAPTVADDPALAARLSELVRQAQAGQAAFDAAMATAETAASGSGASGSESWIAAQIAVSRVEAARVPTVNTLAELDALRVDLARRPTSGNDLAAIASAIGEVQALADAQDKRLDQVRASLSPV